MRHSFVETRAHNENKTERSTRFLSIPQNPHAADLFISATRFLLWILKFADA
jgi:hypothetical protein